METVELHGPKAPDKMPLMKCGHRAQGYRTSPGEKIPACVICAGITPDAYIVVEEPDLSERTARCAHYGQVPTGRNRSRCKQTDGTYEYLCMCEKPSSDNLAFFGHRPNKEYDLFYCGCWGWE